MTHTEEVITTHAQEANHNAERAYWWMKGINRDEAQRLGLNDMVNTTGGVLYRAAAYENLKKGKLI